MKKTATTRRKTMVIRAPQTAQAPGSKRDAEQGSSNTGRLVVSAPQRKASTPTHDKTAKTESPDVSRIMLSNISCATDPGKQAATSGKPTPAPVRNTDTDSEQPSLEDRIDFEYTRYLQTVFRRKLAEAEHSDIDDNLTALQKRIADNQNLLERTTERLKNINFNREVEMLHKLRNPDYGRVLENLENANCKEYLETVNRRLEQSQNQLRVKNIELPEGGTSELVKIMKDTVAACEKLKNSNVLEVPKVMAEIKANNKSTSDTLARCLEMVPEVDSLNLERASLEISSRYN